MDWNRIQSNWKQVTGKAKEQWGKLTDDDLTRIAGQRDQLSGKIQERYGIAREEAEKQLSTWIGKANDSWFVTPTAKSAPPSQASHATQTASSQTPIPPKKSN